MMSTTTTTAHMTRAVVPPQPPSVKRRRILVVPSEYPDTTDPRQFNGNWAEEQVRALAAYHD